MIEVLLRSKEFWASVILLLAALANWLLPTIPKEIVTAFLALLGVIAGVFTGQQVIAARRAETTR